MDKIKCDYCGEIHEFEDDGSVDCMPNGYILPTGEWICDDCGSCPECGKSLEKEPQKRGPNTQPCKNCLEKGAIEQLNEILGKAVISEPLKHAVKETILALEGGDSELAYELTAVKSLVAGELNHFPEVNHFREDTEQNEDILGSSVYLLLDFIHHDLALGIGKIPSGMMVLSANGMREKAESEKQHPVITRIQEERAAIQRKTRT